MADLLGPACHGRIGWALDGFVCGNSAEGRKRKGMVGDRRVGDY